jgi:hypothetical protein
MSSLDSSFGSVKLPSMSEAACELNRSMKSKSISAEPLNEQAFSRLGAVIPLAGLLTDTPNTPVSALDTLPVGVMDSLQLDLDQRRSTFPCRDTFLDLAAA